MLSTKHVIGLKAKNRILATAIPPENFLGRVETIEHQIHAVCRVISRLPADHPRKQSLVYQAQNLRTYLGSIETVLGKAENTISYLQNKSQ